MYVRFLAGTSIIALVGQLACGWLTLRWSMQQLLGIAQVSTDRAEYEHHVEKIFGAQLSWDF